MSRRRTASMIRRAGAPWFVKSRLPDGELTAANCYLKPDNRSLSNTDCDLSLGDLMHPAADPLKLFLVTEKLPQPFHEDYSILPVTNYGQLYRFSGSSAVDTFGRPATTAPALIYAAVPLTLLPSENRQADDSPDRSATTVSYVFQTSDVFQLHPKDRLSIGDKNLIVTAILLSPAGILKFAATVTA